MRRLALIIGFVVLARPAAAQDWSRYQPGSLLGIIAAYEGTAREHGGPGVPNWGISGKDFPTKARLVFTGDHRPLSPERRELLAKWQKAFGMDESVLKVFESEWRFREDSTDIWIAVQRPLEQALVEEGTSGQPLTTLTTFIGSHYAGGAVTWLFLLNEFDASE